MRRFATLRLVTVASLSCVIAGCQTAPAATDGSGYNFIRFSDPQAARLASQDATAGPAINANNVQCREDPACRK